MSLILHLETATESCSATLAENGKILATIEETKQNIHGEKLSVFVDECLRKAGKKMDHLEALAVSSGPGSYTGLRIGVSLAKGICYALNIPFISIDTLHAMTAGIASVKPGYDLYCPILDARRNEVFTTLLTPSLDPIVETKAMIIDPESFSDHLLSHRILFFGNGAEKCSLIIKDPNANFELDFSNSASHMVAEALRKKKSNQYENLAYFEPSYLKEFMGKLP